MHGLFAHCAENKRKRQKKAMTLLRRDKRIRLTWSGIADKLWGVSFFLLMLSVICFGSNNAGSNYFYYFAFFFFLGMSFAAFVVRRKIGSRISLPLQTIWYLLFIVLAIASSVWADSFRTSFDPLRKMIQILIVTYCLDVYIDQTDRLERYLRTVIAASVFMIAYIFLFTPSSQWFAGFLGGVTNLNTNDIGLAGSISVLLSFYYAYVRRRYGYYVVTALSFFTVILTSSRKSLLMSALGMIFLVVFNYRARNYFLRVLVILASAAVALVLIYQIPQLYNTVGTRLDSMIEYFASDRSSDYSIALREYYINMAKQYFRENPLLGIGFNNFNYRVMRYSSTFSYAHNNYWEIASDLGIVGVLVYYWFYVYLLLKHVRRMIDGSKASLLFTVLMLLFLIFEYSMVTFYKMQLHMVLAAAWSALQIPENPQAQGRRSP